MDKEKLIELLTLRLKSMGYDQGKIASVIDKTIMQAKGPIEDLAIYKALVDNSSSREKKSQQEEEEEEIANTEKFIEEDDADTGETSKEESPEPSFASELGLEIVEKGNTKFVLVPEESLEVLFKKSQQTISSLSSEIEDLKQKLNVSINGTPELLYNHMMKGIDIGSQRTTTYQNSGSKTSGTAEKAKPSYQNSEWEAFQKYYGSEESAPPESSLDALIQKAMNSAPQEAKTNSSGQNKSTFPMSN